MSIISGSATISWTRGEDINVKNDNDIVLYGLALANGTYSNVNVPNGHTKTYSTAYKLIYFDSADKERICFGVEYVNNAVNVSYWQLQNTPTGEKIVQRTDRILGAAPSTSLTINYAYKGSLVAGAGIIVDYTGTTIPVVS